MQALAFIFILIYSFFMICMIGSLDQMTKQLIRMNIRLDEVIRNMGGVIASRYSRLNTRKQACEEINKMFGLDIDVVFREDYREADDEMMFAGDTGEKGTMSAMAIDLRTN